MVEVMKIMVTSFERSHSCSATLSATNPHLHWRLLDTHRQVWVSLPWCHCSFLPGAGAQSSVCALPESISQSCVSSGISLGVVNGNLLQEGLCHTQVCYTQNPHPCGRESANKMDWNGWILLRWPLYVLLWARIPEKKWNSHHSQQKSLKCSTWMQSQKQQNVYVAQRLIVEKLLRG